MVMESRDLILLTVVWLQSGTLFALLRGIEILEATHLVARY
jgi:hypothetical protein